jgi:hypothetical protein
VSEPRNSRKVLQIGWSQIGRRAPRYAWFPVVARGLRTWRVREVLFKSWQAISAGAPSTPRLGRATEAVGSADLDRANRALGAAGEHERSRWIAVLVRRVRDGDRTVANRPRPVFQPSCWITIDATAGCVPPASGVIVRAGVLPVGLRSSSAELAAVVVTSASPAIWLVPVARPYTV